MINRSLQILVFLTLIFSFDSFAKKPKKTKATSSNQHESVDNQKLIIKTIQNDTCFDIQIVDRLSQNNSIILPAGKITSVNFIAQAQNAIVIHGSMAHVMAEKAQFVFKKINQNGESDPRNEVYFNLNLTEGGVNNGDGFIVGTPGTTILKFYAAGKQGGCIMNSERIDTQNQQQTEFHLLLHMNEENIKADIFRLNIVRKPDASPARFDSHNDMPRFKPHESPFASMKSNDNTAFQQDKTSETIQSTAKTNPYWARDALVVSLCIGIFGYSLYYRLVQAKA